jgi:hypothetical protein
MARKEIKYIDYGSFIQMSKEDWKQLKIWFCKNSTCKFIEGDPTPIKKAGKK